MSLLTIARRDSPPATSFLYHSDGRLLGSILYELVADAIETEWQVVSFRPVLLA